MVLTLEDCDRILDERRKFGDLHPDRVREEQQGFFDSIKHLSVVRIEKQTL
jgi:hypothetical protein